MRKPQNCICDSKRNRLVCVLDLDVYDWGECTYADRAYQDKSIKKEDCGDYCPPKKRGTIHDSEA